jgi:hypothetical protein
MLPEHLALMAHITSRGFDSQTTMGSKIIPATFGKARIIEPHGRHGTNRSSKTRRVSSPA